MHALGIYKGEQLRELSLPELQKHFGKAGKYYYDIARGIDNRPVKAHRQRKSLGCERTFPEDLHNQSLIKLKLEELAKKLHEMMVARDLKAKTYTIKIKFSDFSQITRSITISEFCNSRKVLDNCVAQLLEKLEQHLMPVRLLGLSASNFLQPLTDDVIANGDTAEDSEGFIAQLPFI